MLQKAAAEGLARKQSALETRIAAQAERLETVTPERVRVRLAVRRATLRGALRQLARVPPLALLRGKVAIRFLGEPAVDAGGAASSTSALHVLGDGGVGPAGALVALVALAATGSGAAAAAPVVPLTPQPRRVQRSSRCRSSLSRVQYAWPRTNDRVSAESVERA